MNKTIWFLIVALLIAVLAVFFYKQPSSVSPVEEAPVIPQYVPSFSAEMPASASYTRKELEAIGWSFSSRTEKEDTGRLARLRMDNPQGEMIELVLLYPAKDEPRLSINVYRHTKKEGEDVFSQVFVNNTVQLATNSMRPVSDTVSEQPLLLSFAIDGNGVVLGDFTLIRSILEKDPRVVVFGFPLDNTATSKQRHIYYQAVKNAKDASDPITDEIKALKPPHKELVHYEFILKGWRDAIALLDSLPATKSGAEPVGEARSGETKK